MAKCLLDIKKDLITQIGERLTSLGADVQQDAGYFPNINKASRAIAQVNAEYKDLVVKEGEKGSFLISPTNRLAQIYLDEYNATKEGQIQINEVVLRPPGFYMGDIALEEQEGRELFLQQTAEQEEKPSVASKEMVDMLKLVAKQMGISIESLSDYAKRTGLNVQGVNGVADLLNGVIAIAEGKEAVAITEEMVHIATAAMEQTSPNLMSEMISKIGRFSIYKRVYDKYSGRKEYQLPNGKPDIRKIKKEAVDQLITEVIINGGTDVEQNPELRDELARSTVKGWWQAILDWFRGRYRKTSISLYEEAAARILKGDVGNIKNVRDNNIYLQLSEAQRQFNDKLVQTKESIRKVESAEKTDTILSDSEEANNYYEKKNELGVWKKLNKRVTDRVKSWYKRVIGDKTFTPEQLALNELKRLYGVRGHKDLQNIVQRYYNADGTRKAVPDAAPLSTEDISLPNMEMYQKLEKYLLEYIDSIRELSGGEPAVFTEAVVYDKIQDEAGTIDLLVVEEDGTTNIIDWKFLQVYGDNDIPWFKLGAFNEQLTAYKRILRDNYGVEKFRNTRAIPILTEFAVEELPSGDKQKYLSAIAIGSVNPRNLEDIRLVPVSSKDESTGIDVLDKIVASLNDLLEQIGQEEWTDEEEQEFKIERMNMVRKAIRYLQGTQDIKPLIDALVVISGQGDRLLEQFKQYEALPATSKDVTNRQLSDFSFDVRNYLQVTRLFQYADEDIVPLIYNEDMEAMATTDEEKQLVANARTTAARLEAAVKRMRKSRRQIEEEARGFGDKHVGQRNLVTGLQSPEIVLKGLGVYFEGAGEINSAAIKILVRLVEEAQVKAQTAATERVNRLLELRNRIKQKHGNIKKYSSKIFQYSDKGQFLNKLIRQYSADFYSKLDELYTAPTANNMQWLKDNVDLDAVRKEAAELLERRIKDIEDNPLYAAEEGDTQEELNRKAFLMDQAIKDKRRTYDVDYEDFAGWNNYIIKRHPLEKWYTEEYKAIKQEGAEALELYNFIREINAEAKESGYISAVVEKLFMPFVRKRTAETFKLQDVFTLKPISNFFGKLQARADDVGYGKRNEVSQELEMSIPKYYTTDFTRKEEGAENDYSDVSEEIFANLVLYIQQLERYKYLDEIEDQVLLVKDIEDFKSIYETTVLGEAARPDGNLVERKSKENNSKLFNQFMRGLLYGQKYTATDSDAPIPVKEVKNFLKIAANAVLGKDRFKVEEELGTKPTYTSVVKSIDNLNMLTQLKFLGLEFMSGTINTFGMQLQMIAQAGEYFNAREVEVNGFKLWKHLFGNDKSDKVFYELVEKFMPLTEDPNYEKYKAAGLTPQTRRKLTDWLMVFMRAPEQLTEKAIFKTLLDNTMVENGKIVSIKQFLKKKYAAERYKSGADFRKYDALIKQEEKELRQTRAISRIAKLDENGKLDVPGLDLNDINEIKRLTLLTRRISSRASGKMTETNRNRASMDVFVNMLMVFKRWIPPLMATRFSQLKPLNDDFSMEVTEEGDVEGDKYEIGRIRLFLYVLSTSLKERSSNIRNILKVNDKGIRKLDELYQEYSKDYEKRTGKPLKMDKAAFYDMVRNGLSRQMTELKILATLLLLLFSTGVIGPDDKEGRAAKNRHRYIQRIIRKFTDEITFFYNPLNIPKQFSAGVPALSIIDDFDKFVDHTVMEVTGLDVSDPSIPYDKVKKKAKPVKYFYKMFPGFRSAINYGAIFSDEFAKEYDVTIPKSSRNR